MKSFILVISLIGLLLTPTSNSEEAKTITVNSHLTKQSYTLDITLPKSYNQDPNKHYPVLYTTSGSSRLKVLTEQVKWLSHVGFAPIPEVIIVNLPLISTDKYSQASGSVDQLTSQVFAKEVIPAIDKKLRTQPYRVVEGFSSNANLILSLFVHNPSLFNAYFVFSPALALDQSDLVDKLARLSVNNNYAHKTLYLSLGSFAENKPLYEKIKKGINQQRSRFPKGLSVTFEDLSQHNFLSAPLIGLVHASQSNFADLQPSSKQFDKSGIAGVKAYYQALKEKYGYKMDYDNAIVDLAFYYGRANQLDKAEKAMNFLIKSSPDNVILPLRLSEIQQAAGQNNKAIQSLDVALKLARQQQNEEAISFIENRMTQLKQ